MRQLMAERLDMLPLNKQVGFFSDAYCVEWVYGKARMVQKQLARVLAEKSSRASTPATTPSPWPERSSTIRRRARWE